MAEQEDREMVIYRNTKKKKKTYFLKRMQPILVRIVSTP